MINQFTQATLDVMAERQRQIEGEGFDYARDDEYVAGELADAAACYAGNYHIRYSMSTPSGRIPALWPWGYHGWNPSGPRRDLVKAAALIIAEIERIDRMEIKAKS